MYLVIVFWLRARFFAVIMIRVGVFFRMTGADFVVFGDGFFFLKAIDSYGYAYYDIEWNINIIIPMSLMFWCE